MTSKSICINLLYTAIDHYVEQNPEGATVEAIPSHIGADFRAYGYAESEDQGAIEAVEEIADQLENTAAHNAV